MWRLERRLMAFADEDSGPAYEWSLRENPAMRALLDHLAELLAEEFLWLMKAPVSTERETEREESQ